MYDITTQQSQRVGQVGTAGGMRLSRWDMVGTACLGWQCLRQALFALYLRLSDEYIRAER